MTIQTLHDAEVALQPYVPLVAQLTGKDTTLERIIPLMELLDNPQDKLSAIHVAGTSGKTSTSYYISSLLQVAGKQVGLTVSPHIDSLNERVQINGVPLQEKVFCTLLGEFLEVVEQATLKPSYFELLYAFALWVFEKSGVDYAVVETGMGGLYDATNVMSRADKVCVITDIGFDHMNILGNSLREIAGQKIGIVHDNNTVIMYEQSAEIMKVVRRWITDHSAELIIAINREEQRNKKHSTASLPKFQQRNWLLAKQVYDYVANRDKLKHLTRQELAQTQQKYIPGRMDITENSGNILVMDGAHNQQKMEAFIVSFTLLFPDIKPAVMIALKTGKDFEGVAPLLAKFANSVIVTTFNTSQDLPAVSLNPTMLADSLRESGLENVIVEIDQKKAYEKLLSSTERVRVVTGSFYLLSQLRHN